MSDVPEHLRRFLPERPEPTLEEQLRAYLAANPPRPRSRPNAPQGRLRVWCGISLAIGGLAAVLGALGWSVVR